MRVLVIIILFFIIVPASFGQPALRPSIGIFAAPNDSDPICPIQAYPGLPDSIGLKKNDTSFDFTLYDLENNPVTLSKILQEKKPVVLICGSYTCPNFREDVPLINSIVETYGNVLSIYIIYAYEAHPIIDPTPYLGASLEETSMIDSMNAVQGVQYRQPKTYGERKLIAKQMLGEMSIEAPVLFDGPCNEWNTRFGPSSTYAYLIGTDGIVKAVHSPFLANSDIENEIANIFQNNTSHRDSGFFSMHLLGTDTVRGKIGSILTITDELVNATGDYATVTIDRVSTNIPENWQSSLCTDACFSTDVISTSVRLSPHAKQEIKIYFYTDSIPSLGRVSLEFSNPNRRENYIVQNTYAQTYKTLHADISSDENRSTIIFPSPAHEKLFLMTPFFYARIHCVDLIGKTFLDLPYSTSYDIRSLPSGIFFVQLISESGQILGSHPFIKN